MTSLIENLHGLSSFCKLFRTKWDFPFDFIGVQKNFEHLYGSNSTDTQSRALLDSLLTEPFDPECSVVHFPVLRQSDFHEH